MGVRLRVVALLGALILIAAACDWSTVGFDATRGGYSAFDRHITVDNVGGLTERWKADAGNHASAPVTGDGRLFVTTQHTLTTDGALVAYDATGSACVGNAPATCAPLWSQNISSFPFPVSPPLLAFDKVWAEGAHFPLPPLGLGDWYYAGGGFDPATGAVTGNIHGAPESATEIASPTSARGAIYGYHTIGWHPLAGNKFATEVVLSSIVKSGDSKSFEIPITGSAPAVSDDVMYVLHLNRLEAYDATGHTNCRTVDFTHEGPEYYPISWTCAPLWTATLSQPIAFDGMPAIAKGRVYVPELSGAVEVFDAAGCGAATCAPSWTAHAGDVHVVPVAVTDTDLFVSSDDGHLYVFDSAGCGAATCEPKWSASLPSGPHAPSIAGSVLFVGTNNGTLAAFNVDGCGQATCSPLWSANVGAGITTAPAIADGRVFVTDTNGTIHAFGLG